MEDDSTKSFSATRGSGSLTMARLPISGLQVELRSPTGAEDLLLAEATDLGVPLALTLAARLARGPAGEEIDWERLPVPDLDAFFLMLRERQLGDRVRAEAVCPAEGCGERIDIAFRVVDYLDHSRPVRPRNVQQAGETGWYRIAGAGVEFRLPEPADLLAMRGEAGASVQLEERCLRPANADRRARRRALLAMAAMAPDLCQDLEAVCPECQASITVRFDPQLYVLRELQGEALRIHEQIHSLALAYHWSEAAILALPRGRRERYVEMAREDLKWA